MRLSRRLILLGILLVLAYPAWIAFQVWEQSRDSQYRPADAIVVLGAAQYDGKPSPVLRARLDQANYLYDEGLSTTVIVTGGKQPGDRFTEAEADRNYLVSEGLPGEAILSEDEGRTTWESLKKVQEIAGEQGAESLLLVSDPMHSERIKRMAADLGFEVYASPAGYEILNRSRITKAKELAREVVSILAYEWLDK
jgi:uncharacterized SAM-binding protein YcdF (DUF218 family)